MIHKNELPICYLDDNKNWGDFLNAPLCSFISNKKVKKIYKYIKNRTFRYYCIGSRLDDIYCENFEVWGTGFMYSNSEIKYKPNKIHAVRGKLSRERYLKEGIDCPEIYGDPALLYPMVYKPKKINKKYAIGIIPHYIDKNIKWINNINDKDITIIDILGETNDFVDKINECEILISSSLHGVIAGDAYEIPSYWVNFSNNVLGDGFKFYDHFSSVGRKEEKTYLNNYEDLKSFHKTLSNYKIDFDFDLLYNSCPFK